MTDREPDNNLSPRARRALLWVALGLTAAVAACFLFLEVTGSPVA